MPNAATKTVAHGIVDYDFFINIQAIAKRGTAGYMTLPLVYHATDATYNASVAINMGNIEVITTQDRSVYTVCYITLYYTKTA